MMLSRVAQNVYWMARYVERAENTARLVRVTDNLLLDLPDKPQSGWEPLLVITGSQDPFYEHYEQADELAVVRFIIADTRNPGSIVSSLTAARENLRTTRDVVPREAWEQINDMLLYARQHLELGITRRGRHAFLKRIITDTQTITGMLAGTMSHTPAYDFIRLGRNLERADMTTRILDVRSANLLPQGGGDDQNPFDNIQWMSVLKSLNGYQMYRQHVRLRVRGPDVLRFLLQDRPFPRSVHHCLDTIGDCLHRLPRNASPLASLASLTATVQDARVAQLAQQGLHEFNDDLQIGLGTLHNTIADTYFSAGETTDETAPEGGQSQHQSRSQR